MTIKGKYLPLLLLAMLSLAGCKGHDSDYFPYSMKGLNVLVYNNNTDDEHFVTFVKANYLNREDGLSQCQSSAHNYAKNHNLDDWSYVCCTVTSSSSCATKVR